MESFGSTHYLHGPLDEALGSVSTSTHGLSIAALQHHFLKKYDAFTCHGFGSELILRIVKIFLLFGLIFFAAAYCI